MTDPHSPARYRINGVVVNMPNFAEAFSCKPGQPMVKPSDQGLPRLVSTVESAFGIHSAGLQSRPPVRNSEFNL